MKKMEHHFDFKQGATIEGVKKVYNQMRVALSKSNQREAVKAAARIYGGMRPQQGIYATNMYLGRRFGVGVYVERTDLDTELAEIRTSALELLADEFLKEAVGGENDPLLYVLRQIANKTKVKNPEEDLLMFNDVIIQDEPPSQEQIKYEGVHEAEGVRMENRWLHLRYSQTRNVLMLNELPVYTGSLYRDYALSKAEGWAREGIKFNPTERLLCALRGAVRTKTPILIEDPRITFNNRQREFAQTAFSSGMPGVAYDELGQLFFQPLDGPQSLIDYYNLIKLGVETGKIPGDVTLKPTSPQLRTALIGEEGIIARQLEREVRQMVEKLTLDKKYSELTRLGNIILEIK